MWHRPITASHNPGLIILSTSNGRIHNAYRIHLAYRGRPGCAAHMTCIHDLHLSPLQASSLPFSTNLCPHGRTIFSVARKKRQASPDWSQGVDPPFNMYWLCQDILLIKLMNMGYKYKVSSYVHIDWLVSHWRPCERYYARDWSIVHNKPIYFIISFDFTDIRKIQTP